MTGGEMTNKNENTWRFNRQINLSVLLELIFLASLIVGSWVNLQRQLDLLGKDVKILVESNARFEQRLERYAEKTIAHEYRIGAIEENIKRKR